MSDDAALIAFMNARLNEEEAEVKGPPGWRLEHWIAVKYADKDSGRNWRVDAEPRCIVDSVVREDAQYIARHNPARALREITAKRAIVKWHPSEPMRNIDASRCPQCELTWPCPTVRLIAAVWSDHPDYRAEWKP